MRVISWKRDGICDHIILSSYIKELRLSSNTVMTAEIESREQLLLMDEAMNIVDSALTAVSNVTNNRTF